MKQAGDLTPFYLGQIGQSANAMTAFALAQNIAATFTLLSAMPVRCLAQKTEPGWLYAAIFVGCALYVGVIAWCRCLELGLLATACPERTIANRLSLIRMACVLVSVVPIAFALLAIQQHPLKAC